MMIKEDEKTPVGFCRKCFIRNMDEETFFEQLHEYMDRIDVSERADPALYEKRLSLCADCDRLSFGMCRVCGMYVEMRALRKRSVCPKVHPAW